MKFTLVALFMVFSCMAYGQFDQGTLYTGGVTAYSSQKFDESDREGKQRTLLGNGVVGVFPAKKFMVGIAAGVLTNKDKSRTTVTAPDNTTTIVRIDNESSSFTVGPIVRYYVYKGFHVEAGYAAGKAKIDNNTIQYYYVDEVLYQGLSLQQKSDAKVKAFSAGIGYSVFLDPARHLALDVGIGYQRNKIDELKYSGFTVGFGVSGFIFRSKVH